MDKTQIAVSIFDACAQQYQDKFMDLSAYQPELDRFCEAILPDDARVLDMACGPGNITRYLLDRRPGLRVLGIDLSENMLVLAAANNSGARFQRLDCRHIRQLAARFDAITCGFAMPYLNKDESIALIRDMAVLLETGGLCYLSTMEDKYERSGWESSSDGLHRAFIHYHEADYLKTTLLENGFELLQEARHPYSKNDGSEGCDLILLARRSNAAV